MLSGLYVMEIKIKQFKMKTLKKCGGYAIMLAYLLKLLGSMHIPQNKLAHVYNSIVWYCSKVV